MYNVHIEEGRTARYKQQDAGQVFILTLAQAMKNTFEVRTEKMYSWNR